MESLRPKILNQIFTASFEKLIDFKSIKMYLLDLGTYLVLIDLPTYLPTYLPKEYTLLVRRKLSDCQK